MRYSYILIASLLVSCSTTPTSSEEVILEFYISEEGRVVEPKIIESTDPIFNEEAMSVLKKWKYHKRQEKSAIQRVTLEFEQKAAHL